LLHHRDLHSFPTRRSSDLIEVVHRGVTHERDREQDHQARPTGSPHEPFEELQDPFADWMPIHPALDVRVDLVPDEEDDDRANRLDRKSTRLNSSHVSISYA